jgi:hypothetical protein
MMICPNCRTRVSEDAVICDSCNHILDASFLGEGITNEKTAEKTPAPADDHRTKVKAIAPPIPTPAMVAPAAALALEEEENAPRRSSFGGTAPPASVNEALQELSQQYTAFPLSERWATGGAAAFLISLALPWRWTEADDVVIGLFAGAWPMGLLALFVALIPFIRRTPRLRPFKEQLLAAGIGASLITLALSGLNLRSSIARGVIHAGGHTSDVWKAYPHVGLGIALLAAFVMLVMSIGEFTQRHKLPDE